MADLQTLLSKFLNKVYAFDQLFSSNYTPSGIISATGTAVGTDADTNRKVLWTFSIPANTLSVSGRSLRCVAWGSCGADANQKDIFLAVGGTDVSQIQTTQNGGGWRLEASIMSVDNATTSIVVMRNQANTTNAGNYTNGAIDWTVAQTISVDGKNDAAVANDIILRGVVLELLLDEAEAGSL